MDHSGNDDSFAIPDTLDLFLSERITSSSMVARLTADHKASAGPRILATYASFAR